MVVHQNYIFVATMKPSYFKDDVIMAIMSHTRKLLLPVAIVGIIFFIILLLIGIVFGTVLAVELAEIAMLAESMGSASSFGSIFETQAQLQSLILANLWGGFGLFLLIFVVVTLILGSWGVNFGLLWSQHHLKRGRANFREVFGASFNKDVWKILGAYILVYIAYSIVSQIVMRVGIQTHWLVILLGMIALVIVYGRFQGAYSAIVHGSMGIWDSYRFSWKHITWIRSVKLAFLILAIVIVFILAIAVIGLAVSVLGPKVEPIVSMITTLGMFVLLYALFVSGMSAIYYRYADDEDGTDMEEHMVETSEV